MTKTFRQLLTESTAPKKVAPKKTTATPKNNAAPAAKAAPKTAPKVLKESNELTLADLGFTPSKAKLDEAAWVIPAPAPTYVDRGDKKYDDSIFDLDASDIGLVFESYEDDEPRDEQNSVDTAEDAGDGTPPVGAASMANKADPAAEGGEEEAGETPAGTPTYQTVTFTVPALMHVLKVVAAKAPDKVTLNSMVMTMAHHCSTEGNTVDVEDLDEIKHKMHGMEYAGDGDADADDVDAGAEGPGPNPSIYATDDVIDGAGEAPEGEEEESEEGGEGKAPEASQKDAQDATNDGEKTDDGKTQLDDEDEESEEKSEDKPDFAKKDAAEGEEPAEKGEEEDEKKEDDDLEESMAFDIESVFESVSDDEVRMIRRRSGLKYWD